MINDMRRISGLNVRLALSGDDNSAVYVVYAADRSRFNAFAGACAELRLDARRSGNYALGCVTTDTLVHYEALFQRMYHDMAHGQEFTINTDAGAYIDYEKRHLMRIAAGLPAGSRDDSMALELLAGGLKLLDMSGADAERRQYVITLRRHMALIKRGVDACTVSAAVIRACTAIILLEDFVI